MTYLPVVLKGGGFQFTDDTVLYCTSDDCSHIELQMNRNLKKLESWCIANRLTINSKKTKFVLFDKPRSANLKANLSLLISGDRLSGVDTYDYLGIMLDSTLTFRAHIDKIIAGCNQRIFSLAKIRKYVPLHVAVLIYKAVVMSKLNYGGMLCLGAAKSHLARLQKLQNRICHCASRYTSNIKLHTISYSNVLSVYPRRKLDVYKCMFGRMMELERNPPVDENCPTTRFSSSRPPSYIRPNCERFLSSITYQAPTTLGRTTCTCKNSKRFSDI